jgi:hypothetical protein
MVIGSNAVLAAITQVDARSGCKFTAPQGFFIYVDLRRCKQRHLICRFLAVRIYRDRSPHAWIREDSPEFATRPLILFSVYEFVLL